jgi:hypothetical protein
VTSSRNSGREGSSVTESVIGSCDKSDSNRSPCGNGKIQELRESETPVAAESKGSGKSKEGQSDSSGGKQGEE